MFSFYYWFVILGRVFVCPNHTYLTVSFNGTLWKKSVTPLDFPLIVCSDRRCAFSIFLRFGIENEAHCICRSDTVFFPIPVFFQRLATPKNVRKYYRIGNWRGLFVTRRSLSVVNWSPIKYSKNFPTIFHYNYASSCNWMFSNVGRFIRHWKAF